MKYLTPFILILVAIGLYFFYISPTLDGDIAQKESVRDQYNTAIDTTKQLALVLGGHIDTYNSFTSEELERLARIVPETIDPLRLIVDVNALARTQGLRITDITVSEEKSDSSEEDQQQGPAEPAGFDDTGATQFAPVDFSTAIKDPELVTTRLEFSVVATYKEFLTLLENLEESLRIMDVISITVSKESDGDDSSALLENPNMLSYTVELHTYSLGTQ